MQIHIQTSGCAPLAETFPNIISLISHTHTLILSLTQTQKAIIILGRPPCATSGNPPSGHLVWSGSSCLRADWRWLRRPLSGVELRWVGSAAGRHPRHRAGPSVRDRGMLHRTESEPCQSLPGGRENEHTQIRNLTEKLLHLAAKSDFSDCDYVNQISHMIRSLQEVDSPVTVDTRSVESEKTEIWVHVTFLCSL